jgi:predicted 3-demethylubiquinone-9 3-methyltransferase (glyoxalase superfamily)
MSKSPIQKIVPHLWYAKEAAEAARFYATVFPDSHVDRVISLPADSPRGPTVLGDMITDPDRAKAKRVTEAMLKQVKIDIAKLEAAYRGN